MTDTGVSKKLCITAASIAAIVSLSSGVPATEKWKFAAAIAGLCIVYKLVQGFIDWKKKVE